MESTFRKNIPNDCCLIETFRFDPEVGHVHLNLHLNRMCDTARRFGFRFSRRKADEICDAIVSDKALRCRLTLGCDGEFNLVTQPLEPAKSIWRIAFSDVKLSHDDLWLRHKTNQRKIYDEARANLPNGVDELLFQST